MIHCLVNSNRTI